MKKFILILLVVVPCVVNAQTILLEKTVVTDTIPETYGPNLKHYTHTYVGFGSIFGTTVLPMETAKSYEFISGIRYKNKLSELYSLGFNLSYNIQSFRLEPTAVFINYDKEKITVNNLEFELYNRFNFGKRGNIIGKYIDIGGYFSYAVSTKHYYRITSSNFPQNSSSKHRETIYKNLSNINAVNYGLTARIGWNWISIYSKYRLSNIGTTNYPELPRFILGLELSVIN